MTRDLLTNQLYYSNVVMRFALRQDCLSSASCIFHYQIMGRRYGEDDLRIPLHQSTAGEVE
jgi:hypothetical protein